MDYYQQLITGEKEIYDVPVIGITHKIKLLYVTLRALKVYKTDGARTLLNQLPEITPMSTFKLGPQPQNILFARHLCVFVQTIINHVRPKAICLERSSTICLALRNMGIPAQVIIGRKAAANSSSDYDFHAWVEVENIPVNDHYSNKTYFMEIERIPAWAERKDPE